MEHRRRLPPLNALRAFEAAARHLNFSRAADELSVTPGAVSQQIQNLEDYVGVSLFKRTPKGLLLTAILLGGVDEAIHKDPVAMMRLMQSYHTRALAPTQECKATGSSGWAHGTDA